MKKLLLPLLFCLFILDAFMLMFRYENYPWFVIGAGIALNVFLVLLGIALLYIIVKIRNLFVNMLKLLGIASSFVNMLSGHKKTEDFWFDEEEDKEI